LGLQERADRNTLLLVHTSNEKEIFKRQGYVQALWDILEGIKENLVGEE